MKSSRAERGHQDIELPRLRRAPASYGGHALYEAGEISICQYHQYCAYTGDERDRCRICHSPRSRGCEHAESGGLPPGRKSPCLCRQCNELFTSISAFNKHIKTGSECIDPEECGLVLVEQKGWIMWSGPGSPPPGSWT